MQILRTSRMDTRLGLRFREEEGWAGGKNKDNFGQGNNIDRKELRIDLGKDEEARVDLTRNAPDEKS